MKEQISHRLCPTSACHLHNKPTTKFTKCLITSQILVLVVWNQFPRIILNGQIRRFLPWHILYYLVFQNSLYGVKMWEDLNKFSSVLHEMRWSNRSWMFLIRVFPWIPLSMPKFIATGGFYIFQYWLRNLRTISRNVECRWRLNSEDSIKLAFSPLVKG